MKPRKVIAYRVLFIDPRKTKGEGRLPFVQLLGFTEDAAQAARYVSFDPPLPGAPRYQVTMARVWKRNGILCHHKPAMWDALPALPVKSLPKREA